MTRINTTRFSQLTESAIKQGKNDGTKIAYGLITVAGALQEIAEAIKNIKQTEE